MLLCSTLHVLLCMRPSAIPPTHPPCQNHTVPEGATFAELRLKAGPLAEPIGIMARMTQLLPHTRYSSSEKRAYLQMSAHDVNTLTVAVAAGTALEVTLAQFWSSLGDGVVHAQVLLKRRATQYTHQQITRSHTKKSHIYTNTHTKSHKITHTHTKKAPTHTHTKHLHPCVQVSFFGVECTPNAIPAHDSITKLMLRSTLRAQQVKPVVKLTHVRISLPPTDSTLTPLHRYAY